MPLQDGQPVADRLEIRTNDLYLAYVEKIGDVLYLFAIDPDIP